MKWVNEFGMLLDVSLSTDASGRKHRGAGEGGGQFISGDDAQVFKVKPPKKLYRGVMTSGEGAGVYSLGKGLYSTRNKSFLKNFKYDEVIELDPVDAFPRNPLVLRNSNDFTDWLLRESGLRNIREFNAKYPDPGEFVQSKGYDGVLAGDEVVKYTNRDASLSFAMWSDRVQRACLLEANGDVEAGLAAARYIIATQSVPMSVEDQPRDDIGRWSSDKNRSPKKPTEDQIPNGRIIAGGIVYSGPFELKRVPISKLKLTEEIDTPSKSRKIAKSIKKRQPIPPIVVDRFGKVLDGHHRLDAAKTLGLTHIWVMREKRPIDVAFGMVGDKWHGPKPPGAGWAPIQPGPHGGKRWKRAQGGAVPQATPPPGAPAPVARRGKVAPQLVAGILSPSIPKPPTKAQQAATLKQALQKKKAEAQEIIRQVGKDTSKVTAESIDAFLAHDVHNRAAQGILNRTLKAAKGMSAAARRDLATALERSGSDSGAAILDFVNKYRLQLARLLTATQMAALLEGAVEVAEKVPPLGEVPVEGLPIVEQEAIIEAQAEARQPSAPTFTPPHPPANSPEEIHFPTIEAAVENLSARNVMSRQQYDALDAVARAKSFTVANVAAEETLTKIRDSLADNIKEGVDHETWKSQVLQDVDAGTFLGAPHMETVFRTNVQSSFSDGQMSVLQNPLVRSGFPYAEISAIHDDRVRDNHLEVEKIGINGGPIFRIDDPVFQTFRPPWDYNCRCGFTPMTVRQASEAGVSEAQEWLRTGVEPSVRAFVPMPPFSPPEGFQRALAGAPLSIRLSLQSLATFAHDVSSEKRDEGGKWTKSGTNASDSPPSDVKDARGWFKRSLAALGNAPVVRHIRACSRRLKKLTTKFFAKVEERYGRKTAVATLVAGQAVGWGATGAGAMVGVPIWLPGASIWGGLPVVAVAEVSLQFKRAKKAVGLAIHETSDELVDRLAAKLMSRLKKSMMRYIKDNTDELKGMSDKATFSTDAGGRDHRGKGSGGGQFTKGDSSSAHGGKADLSGGLPPSLARSLGNLTDKPGMLPRLKHMVSVANAKLAPVFAFISEDVIPNAWEHARNALLSTALPGIPVNDIAVGLSKVIAWAWHKAKKRRSIGATAALALDHSDPVAVVLELTKIFYEMADLDLPLPTREVIEESLKRSKPMSITLAQEYHGPTPPGNGWVQHATGPRGGKIWRKIAAKPGFFGRLLGKKEEDKHVAISGPDSPAETGQFHDPLHSQAVQDVISGKSKHSMVWGTLGGKQDTMLQEILKETGRDAKPRLTDSDGIDKLKSEGWRVAFRGETDIKFVDQFREGDLYCGSGKYGNGTYVQGFFPEDTPRASGHKDESEAFRSARGYGEFVMRMALAPDIKVLDWEEFHEQKAAYQKKIRKDMKDGKITEAEHDHLYAITSDPGRFAALNNYDAIRATEDGYIVVLNRAKVVVQKKRQP